MPDTDTKHTPGPWEVSALSDLQVIKKDPRTIFRIAICHDVSALDMRINGAANALLIAAAPDLLGAAVFALDIIETHLPELSDGSMATRLRDAIKKAEAR